MTSCDTEPSSRSRSELWWPWPITRRSAPSAASQSTAAGTPSVTMELIVTPSASAATAATACSSSISTSSAWSARGWSGMGAPGTTT